MKIDDTNLKSSAPVEPVTPDTSRSNAASPKPAAASDSVRVSPDVRLVRDLVKLTDPGNDVRSQLIERARELLGQGQMPMDLEQLADRLIDAVIDAHDDYHTA